MASVNKQSLREEFDSIKLEFTQLSSTGKMTVESQALFKALLILFELMLAVFMEKTTRKDNKNSSIPSSQTQKDETSTIQPGTNGKGNKQNDALCSNTRTIETTRVAKVTVCEGCGEDLRHTPIHHHANGKDAQKSILSLKRWSFTLRPKSSNVRSARRKQKGNFQPTCLARYNMGRASRPLS